MSEEVEEVGEEVEEQVDPEIEQEALDMGWAPKEKWRGDPDQWVDAETFVKRGREVLPIVRSQAERIKSENQELKTELEQLRERQQRMAKKLIEKEKAKIKKRQQEAVKEGDSEAFNEAETELKELDKEAEEQPTDPVFENWMKNNKWYNEDFELHDYANRYGEFLKGQGVQGKEFLDKISDAVKEKFPDRFENQRRKKPSDVEKGGRGAKKKSGKTYDNLPPEAKRACDEFVQDGVMTVDEYVQAYEWDE